MKREEKIKSSTELMEIADDLDEVAAIDAVATSEGGKILLKGLMADVASAVESIAMQHKTLTLQEFISYGAAIKERLDIANALSGAQKNKEYLSELLEQRLLGIED